VNPTASEKRGAQFFLIWGLALAVVAVLLADKDIMKRLRPMPMQRYRLELRNSIVGIEKGTLVRYLGAPVGEVVDARASATNLEMAELVINVKQGQHISASTRARLASEGLIKNYYVELFGSKLSEPALPVDSVIAADSSTMRQIMEAGSDTVERIDKVLTRLEQWLSGENEAKIRTLVETTTAAIKTIDDTFKSLEPDTKRMVSGMAKTAEDLDAFFMENREAFRTMVTDTAGVATRLRKFLESGRLETTTDAMAGSMASVSKDASALRGAAVDWMQANRIGEDFKRAVDALTAFEKNASATLKSIDNETATIARSEIVPTLRSLQEASIALEALMNVLRSNPSLLLFSKPAGEIPLPRSQEPPK